MIGRKKQTGTEKRSMREQAQRSAPVFSYYSSRNPSAERTDRRKDTGGRGTSEIPTVRFQTKSWWILYLPSLVSLGVVAGAVLFLTTLSPDPKIDIRASSEDTRVIREMNVYEDVASAKLSESILYRSKLTIQTDKIARELHEAFPELDDVVVVVPLFGRRPIIEAQPARPSLVLVGNNGTYIIDTDGTAVLKASQLDSSVRDTLPVVTDQTGMEIDIGKQILPTDSVAFITELSSQFQANKTGIESILLPVVSNEVHLRPTGKTYFIKFNTEYEARLQAGTYFALKSHLEGEGKEVSEYIDVRVEERAYYR